MLNVPSNIVTDIASTTAATSAQLFPIIAVFIAIPLTFYFIKRVKELFPKK